MPAAHAADPHAVLTPAALLKAGRKFHQADEKLLKEAEKVLHGEFAHVLQIAPEEVAAFIMGELGAEERTAE